MKEGRSGINADTSKKILFGAGTYHKGLKYSSESGWNFATSCIGATSGGGKFEIIPEITNIDIDGANVSVKGLTEVKTGETATMEVNPVEITKDIIKSAVIGADGESADESYDLIESKPDIEEGDYWENIAFVGRTLAGKNIIVIMDNALCTSGISQNGQKKAATVGTYTFRCTAEQNETGEYDTLPWRIYYPKSLQ